MYHLQYCISKYTVSDTVLKVLEPTMGATNYQVVLEGVGSGAGLWLGGTGGCRVKAQVVADACAGTQELGPVARCT